jgi:phosphoenolpyruvate synthase/pyruvate phosphate dikinase
MTYALRLDECTADLAGRVGGKAVGLGHLLRQELEVPSGFVVTTDAYRDWLASRGLARELDRLLGGLTDSEASRQIAALFESADPSDALVAEVQEAYTALGAAGGAQLVAVRSSATAEDMADASFAGQQETYLGIAGVAPVIRHVVRCWASLFTPQAISYRRRLGIPNDQVAMAVLVQRMVAAEASGVMLTLDPVTGDRSQITIESALGLGAPLVGGELTPDRYAIDKVTLEIRSRTISVQPFADRLEAGGGVRRVDLAEAEGAAPSLGDDEALRLAEIGKRTERALHGPVDIEWAIGPGPEGPRHLYLLQARPETVWSQRRAAPVARPATTPMDRIVAMMVPKGTRSQST